jgi:hypothetical protein
MEINDLKTYVHRGGGWVWWEMLGWGGGRLQRLGELGVFGPFAVEAEEVEVGETEVRMGRGPGVPIENVRHATTFLVDYAI